MIDEHYFIDFPRLETPRLVLRKLKFEDAKYFQNIRSDERVMEFMDSNRHLKLEDSEKFIAENLANYTQKKAISWALIEKTSKYFIGDFSFWAIDHKNSRAEVGYVLRPEYWGKGFMKEALREIFSFGFQKLNLHSLEANINPANTKSRGLLKSLGFVKEAYFRENYYYDGQYLDSEIYSLLEKNFKHKI